MKILLITKSKFPPGVNRWQIKKSIIHLILNFTTMKKSIFILLMALFAIGVTTAYGQLVPRAITCLPADAFHPIAGTPYTYSITVPTPLTGTRTILWRVTQDETFITNKVLVAAAELPGTSDYLASADADYNTFNPVAPGNLDMVLTWKSFAYDPANPIFVIVHVANDDGTCNINNMKVYRIEPITAFTLDIANKDLLGAVQPGYGQTALPRCIANIFSATYNNAGTGSIDYDFGLDTIYYEVVAANWSGQWKPSIQVSALDPEETVVSVDWAYLWSIPLWVGHAMPYNGVDTYISTDNVEPQGTPPPPSVGAAGQSIFIRMIIDHTVDATHNYEGLTDETFKLAVDGELYALVGAVWTATGSNDIHWDNGTTPPCPLNEDGFTNDYALQTLKARPDIQDATPPPGNDYLPVTP
jgi:hypothetical protein